MTWSGLFQQGERELVKKGLIASYSAEELAAMQARGDDRTDWARVDAKTEAELAADLAGDAAWAGVPEDWVSQAHAPTGLKPQPRENKRQVTIRFDADGLDSTCATRGGAGRDA
jgi:hypothetical protein